MTSTPAARSRIRVFRLTIITFLFATAVVVQLHLGVSAKQASNKTDGQESLTSNAAVTIQAAGRGKPYFNFTDGRQVRADYVGQQNVIQAIQSGQAQPRSLASADLDSNGTPDVLAGYAYGGTGIVTIQRGNPEAFAPTDLSVYERMAQGYNPDALLPTVETIQVPTPVDFLEIGDFNNDGRKDLLVGGRLGGLFFIAGDSNNGWLPAQAIEIGGALTALAAGEFRAADGKKDVAVGVNGPGGSQVLIYDGAEGCLTASPMQFSLSSEATVIRFGGVDDDPFIDAVVATADDIAIIHGWGRKQTPALDSRVEHVPAVSDVRGLSLGHYVWDREARLEIAALSGDGTLQLIERTGLNTNKFTEAELATHNRGTVRPQLTEEARHPDLESFPAWSGASKFSWTSSRSIRTNLSARSNSNSLLMKTNMNSRETDEMVIAGRELTIVRQIDPQGDLEKLPHSSSTSISGDLAEMNLESAAAPIAVLQLPAKVNGERSMLVLQDSAPSLSLVPFAPATITVDRFDDPDSGAPLQAADNCTGVANDCSLRGAVEFANLAAAADQPTTINLPAGTYTLDNNGTSIGGCDNNPVGDLTINGSVTMVGLGGGAIIQQLATGVSNDGDRAMCLNLAFAINKTYSFSNLTIVGGRDGTSPAASNVLGGGAIIGGELDNSVTLTNVTLANNQVLAPLMGTNNNGGGGGIQITGGDLTITNCTIGGASAPGAYTDRTNTTTANLEQNGSGGGVTFTPSSPQHMGGTGDMVITGTTINRNVASGIGGGGAEMLIFAFGSPGGIGSGSASFSGCTFSNNQTQGTADGGALFVESLPTTVATTAFDNNSSQDVGGAISVAGGGLTLNGTNPSVTFTGNTAPNGGTSISTAYIVTVQGTNMTIGGSILIAGNGVWNNSAGSVFNPTDVVIQGGTYNCSSSTTNITGNLTISPAGNGIIGSTFNGDTGTVNLAGNFSYTAGGTTPVSSFNAGTSTFNFNGTGSQSISNTASITFNNLTDSNITQPLLPNNNFNVNGSLNVNGTNAIFAPPASIVIGGTGTLTGTGTAQVRRTGADSFFGQYSMTNKTLTNLTVEYIGAAAQTASVTTYGKLKINNGNGVTLGVGSTNVNGLLTLQTGTLGVGANTLVINAGTSIVGGTLTSGTTGTVSYNQGGAGQDVRAFNYGNLTFSAFTKLLPSTGTIGVAGTFNPNGLTSGHTITGSTFDFNGIVAQTVPAFNYNNLTISGARTTNSVTLINGGTIGIAGAFAPTSTFTTGNYIVTGNTVDFNGAGAQTIPAFNYNNLTISGNRAVAITLGNGTVGVGGVFNPSVTGNTWTANPTNTVVFNGSALQTIPAFAFFNGLTLSNATGANLGGNVTVLNALSLSAGALGVGINTLTLNGAASFGAGSLTSSPTGTVNYNQQSNAQATVLAANYGNLTFSNFNKTLASTGTIGIAGTFTPGSATGHTITGSTINFNGAGAQTIPGFTYNNLTSSGGAAARTLDSTNPIKIAGVFTPGTNVYTIGGSTIEYNGSVAQTMPAAFTTYNNLTLNNAAGVSGFAGLSVQGLLRVQAGTFTSSSTYNNVQIDSGATLAATAGSTINVGGNWTNNGTFTPSTGTVIFNGNNTAQTLTGNTTFNNLTINHTGTGFVTATGTTLTVGGLMRTQGGTFTLSGGTFANVQIDSGTTLGGANGTTMNVSGNWTNNGGTFGTNGNTMNFNGAVAQSINGTAGTQSFDNFTVNKSGASTLSIAGSTTQVNINGNLLLTLGNLSAGTATTINVAGNWTNNGGAFVPGSGTVGFTGGAGQAIDGTTATTFNGLTNSNAAGLAMNNNNTVNGILALLNSDIIVANTRTLTQPSTTASIGTFDVVGTLTRSGGPFALATPLTFGNPSNILTITAGATRPSTVTVALAKAVPANPNGYGAAVQRTYTISQTGGTGFTSTLRLHYLDSELNGNTEASLNLRYLRPSDSHWLAALPTTLDTTNNWVESNAVSDVNQLSTRWTMSSLTPTASGAVITGRIVDSQGHGVEGTVVRLQGTQNRKFITDANGYYSFDNVETNGFYTVTPSRVNYTFSPSERSFSQLGQTTSAAFAATVASTNLQNPLDTPEYFVRQHYLDFLGREPDEAGFNFWSDQIIGCGNDQACSDVKRENVSAAYFLSIEFQETGGLVDGLYRAAYGARPHYAEFMPDTRAVGLDVIVGTTDWQTRLATNKDAFVRTFVERPAFHAAFDSLSNENYVATLISNTGVSFTAAERESLVNGLAGGTMTRADVLRRIAEDGRFVRAKFNETFVMMEYFGYLRRDPDESGFNFWLNKLNQHNGNFEQAEMVKAFIVSGEYRDRFPR